MKSLLLLDLTGKVFSRKEKILYWVVSAFFLSLFLPDMPVVSNVLIGAMVLQSCFYNSIAEKWRLLRERREIGFMLLFFGLQILSGAMSSNRQEALVMLALRAPLFIFPLFLGLLYIREELKDRILLAYCFYTTIAAIACMLYAVNQYRISGDSGSLYDDSLTQAIGRQSIYIAMTVNLALFTYVYLLQKKSFAIEYKGLVFLAIIFLFVFNYLLASRIAIITLYTGFLIFAIWHVVRARKYAGAALLLTYMVIVAALLIHFFPKTLNRFHEMEYMGYQYNSQAVESHYNMALTSDQWNGANIRLAIWKCGMNIAQNHWVTGVPLGDKQDKLMEEYRARNFDFALRTRRNMHNNYLDVFVNTGIIGLSVFLLGYLVIPVLTCIRYKDGLGLFVVLGFAIAMITETWTDRSIGCIMMAFFLSLVSAWKIESLPTKRPAHSPLRTTPHSPLPTDD